ncbi:SPFH domain / Band 7 family protein [Thalassococcus halodurans]|uniref:SPFH domain / Band 7 family protein n=1 Tax=Thalassococcus halodurans TaxID=373675 RepID=A0A1H5Z0C5_9RHOB|nr:flotillin domain-containing protein [Thalassococcus halodurans]SEG29734.1 SPFH domain / Band 7 family protein [Thalassococcus halodurans]
MDPLNFIIMIATVIAFLVLIGLVLGRLYRRSTREVSLVKTGAGGKRIIMDGGTIVIPLLHEISPVNMKTLRLEVQRNGEAALITKDRMRVDVGVEFYVSVSPTEEGIARAAQTLGDRTFYVDQLREMIEGKLIDGLRAVAAQMSMDELHENRSIFVQEVQNAVSEDLLKNGLSLESVSLTALDQTPFEALDENNAFNAVGMRKLAEVIALSKKERATIDAEADVAVRRAAMEAERQKLIIEQDEEQARIEQSQKVETLRAAQEAEIAARREDSRRETERSRIALIEAQREAEREATRIRLAAQAEKDAAQDRADARREEAQADADAITIRAEAKKKDMLAEAEGTRAITEAENALSAQIVAMKVDLARLQAMPGILAEVVKPVEKIDTIKIHQVTGMGGGNFGAPMSAGGEKPVVNQALDSIMGMAVQMPALKKLGDELGMSMEDGLAGMVNGALGGDTPKKPVVEEAPEPTAAE